MLLDHRYNLVHIGSDLIYFSLCIERILHGSDEGLQVFAFAKRAGQVDFLIETE